MRAPCLNNRGTSPSQKQNKMRVREQIFMMNIHVNPLDPQVSIFNPNSKRQEWLLPRYRRGWHSNSNISILFFSAPPPSDQLATKSLIYDIYEGCSLIYDVKNLRNVGPPRGRARRGRKRSTTGDMCRCSNNSTPRNIESATTEQLFNYLMTQNNEGEGQTVLTNPVPRVASYI